MCTIIRKREKDKRKGTEASKSARESTIFACCTPHGLSATRGETILKKENSQLEWISAREEDSEDDGSSRSACLLCSWPHGKKRWTSHLEHQKDHRPINNASPPPSLSLHFQFMKAIKIVFFLQIYTAVIFLILSQISLGATPACEKSCRLRWWCNRSAS